MAHPFADFYRGKTVLVTGDTGFKGSWLAIWLSALGARVVGYALEPPSHPSNFDACRLGEHMPHIHGDVRQLDQLEEVFQAHRPDVVFHLAAQSLVRRSFIEPRMTFEVNLMGTVNVLEAARRTGSVAAVVLVTSDKCYRNREWEWGYRETDTLGGHDAYSGSKACAELAVAVYQDQRFRETVYPGHEMAIASVRAGNVIGGGDWASDRIVPDTFRALSSRTDVVIRNPHAVRPWQHVLEPLSGYLWLGYLMTKDPKRYGAAWNFGPGEGEVVTVEQLVTRILTKWGQPASRLVVMPDETNAESLLLRLDCSKAKHHLHWRATWDIDRTLDAVVAWYKRYYRDGGDDMYTCVLDQIEEYTACARRLGLAWAHG